MILSLRISWLCTLLWGCICFPALQGYNIAPSYPVNDDGFSNHVGVPDPHTSNQFQSEASLNTIHDSVSPRDDMQAVRYQGFVSPQREPVHHGNNEETSSVTSLSEEIVQKKLDSGQEPDKTSFVPSSPSVQQYEHESSGNQHPFNLLVKDHAQKKIEGVSFPTMTDFKRFIETMKSSFLTPGSDLTKHFQTARRVMKNEVTSNVQQKREETDTGYKSYPTNEVTAHDVASENEVWSEPVNTVFAQSEQGTTDKMPSESLYAPDPVNSIESLISTTVYDNQGSGPGSALYARPHLAATGHVSSNYGSFENADIYGENSDIFTTGPDVQNDVHSTSYKLQGQIPSVTFAGEDFPFSGHVTASAVNPQNSPSQDFNYYSNEISNLTPPTSERMYTTQSKDSLTEYQKPLDEDFQSEEIERQIPVNMLPAPNPPSLNSYAKSVYINTPRRQHNILDYLPKHRQRPAPTFQPHQAPVNKGSKYTYYAPTVHQPVLSGSVSLNSNTLVPQNSSGHVGVQTSSLHNTEKHYFNREQPVRSHRVFTVKPSSSLNSYLGDQRVGVTPPSTPTDQANEEERSDLPGHNPVSTIQEPQQMTDNTLSALSGPLDFTKTGISYPVGVDYASLNSVTNLVPTSSLKTSFSRPYGIGDKSRNFEVSKINSDKFSTGEIFGARTTVDFSIPHRGISLNGGYLAATRADFPRNSFLLTKLWRHLANVNKEQDNVAYQQPKPLSVSKVSGSTLNGVFWRNGDDTKMVPGKSTGPRKSTPSVRTYTLKSRKSYARSKTSLSKTHYAPYHLNEGKTGENQWKPAPRKQNHKNTVSHNANGSEEE